MNMNWLMKLCGIAMVALLHVGCGNNSPGGGDPGPSNNPPSKITGEAKNALTGSAAVMNAGFAMGAPTQKEGRAKEPSGIILAAGLASATPEQSDKAIVKSKTDKLTKALGSGSCTISVIPGEPSNSQQPIQFGIPAFQLKVLGKNCPVVMDMTVAMTFPAGGEPNGTSPSGKITMDVSSSYEIFDEELLKELQTRTGEFTMKMSFDFVVSGDSSKLKLTNTALMRAVDLNSQVQLVSFKADGDFTQVIQKNPKEMPVGAGISGPMRIEFNYINDTTKVSSILKASMVLNEGKPTEEKYWVDGISVTREAFQRELDKFGSSVTGEPAKDNQDSGSQNADNPEPPAPPPHGAYKMSYQLISNGCDTGKHQFAADSEAEVRQAYCQALQNETLNHGCAQELRRQRFNQQCPGMPWSPR